MARVACLKILPLFYGLVLGYTINKAEQYPSKSLNAVKDEITSYLKRHNASLHTYDEFETIWDSTYQILQEVAARQPIHSEWRIPHVPDEKRNAVSVFSLLAAMQCKKL